jgi:hypothetical protein
MKKFNLFLMAGLMSVGFIASSFGDFCVSINHGSAFTGATADSIDEEDSEMQRHHLFKITCKYADNSTLDAGDWKALVGIKWVLMSGAATEEHHACSDAHPGNCAFSGSVSPNAQNTRS